MKDEIRKTLDALNRAWLNGRFEDLAGFFDQNVVMKGPGLGEVTRGRDALVQSYADFMRSCKVVDFRESNHRVDCWGHVAAASYDWSMKYEREGEFCDASGHELFALILREGRWIAVLRIMLM